MSCFTSVSWFLPSLEKYECPPHIRQHAKHRVHNYDHIVYTKKQIQIRVANMVKVKFAQSCLTLQPQGLCSPWDSPGQNTGVGSCSLLQGIFPTQGLNPGLPTLQADSLPAEPPGKPKNTAVDSLSLLQEIFLTQELNWGLLHCRWIFYQLSYQ